MSWLLTEEEIREIIPGPGWPEHINYNPLEHDRAIAKAQLTSIAKRLKAGINPDDLKALYKEAGLE